MADAIVRMGRPQVTEDVGSRGALTALKASLMIPIVRIVKGVEGPARTRIRSFSDAAGMKKAAMSVIET